MPHANRPALPPGQCPRLDSRGRSSRARLLLAGAMLGSAIWSLSTSAWAATLTATIGVSANVTATCSIATTPLGFGNYSGALVDVSATVTVTCSNLAAYNVGLDAGTTASSTVAARAMAGPGTAVLNYALFSDTTHTTNWGNTVGTDTVAGVGSGALQTLTVYGQEAAGQQLIQPGAYTDTVTATITY